MVQWTSDPKEPPSGGRAGLQAVGGQIVIQTFFDPHLSGLARFKSDKRITCLAATAYAD